MNYNAIYIRRATVNDAEILAQLGAETWVNTYITDKYTETMQAEAASTFHLNQLIKQLRDPQSIFLIAEVRNTPVGFAQMHNGDILECITGPKPIEIERFYIENAWFGKGVALHLILSCLSYARQNGFETIWLTVWKSNEKARAFYEQWKFSDIGIYYFKIGERTYENRVLTRSTQK